MKRFFQYFGFVAFISLLVYGASYIYEQFPKIVTTVFMTIGVATVLVLIVRLVLGRAWIAKIGTEFFIGNDLIKALENFLTDLPNPKKETTANLVGHIIYRFTRLGLVGLVIAIIPAWLLYQQNQLFVHQNERIDEQTEMIKTQTGLLRSQDEKFGKQNEMVEAQTGLLRSQDEKFGTQNELMTFQNDRIAEQTGLFRVQNSLVDTQNYRLNLQNNLIEAERRSSLVFLMSNVLDKVDDEIREQRKEVQDSLGNVPDSIKFSLSTPLVGRIVALSRAFKPYRLLEADTLSGQLVSPERGQLFIALMENRLDSATQNTLVTKGEFTFALVEELDLERANFSEAFFDEANLRHSNCTRANLRKANFGETDLYGAIFVRTNLQEAWLLSSDLRTAKFTFADLRGADLRLADLSFANLQGSDLRGSKLQGAKLDGAKLDGAQGLNSEMLKSCTSIYQVQGLPDSLAIKFQAQIGKRLGRR